jgi:peptide deformylase
VSEREKIEEREDERESDAHEESEGVEREPEELDPERAARRRAALAQVRQFGDPVLRSKAARVQQFDAALAAEAERMGRLMDDAIGVGLAANQVGTLHRLLVYRVEEEGEVHAIANPTIEWSSDDREIGREGCLSLPGVWVEVERPISIRVSAQDLTGAPLEIEAEGFEARVLQHEIDHLEGTLILDRISRDDRREAMRTMREAREAKEAD